MEIKLLNVFCFFFADLLLMNLQGKYDNYVCLKEKRGCCTQGLKSYPKSPKGKKWFPDLSSAVGLEMVLWWKRPKEVWQCCITAGRVFALWPSLLNRHLVLHCLPLFFKMYLTVCWKWAKESLCWRINATKVSVQSGTKRWETPTIKHQVEVIRRPDILAEYSLIFWISQRTVITVLICRLFV